MNKFLYQVQPARKLGKGWLVAGAEAGGAEVVKGFDLVGSEGVVVCPDILSTQFLDIEL